MCKGKVADFICRLEHKFKLALGETETRNALLYSQLQDGLKEEKLEGEIIEGGINEMPAVSGGQNFSEFCVNKERDYLNLKDDNSMVVE